MKLTAFLNGLFNDGMATVPREVAPIEEADQLSAVLLILRMAAKDRLELAGTVPEPDEVAALWAATYLFRIVQFIMQRDLTEEVMDANLPPYPGERSAEAVYGVDLVFRHFGPIFKLAAGLAPADPLVVKMKQTAAQWPLSSVGTDVVADVSLDVIMAHPSLRYLYGDRVIAARDLSRTKTEAEQLLLREIIGEHQAVFWPNLELAPAE